MEKPFERVYLAKEPYLFTLSLVLQFLKGALPIWIVAANVGLQSGWVLLALATIVLHNWAFRPFENPRRQLIFPAWGMFAAFWPPLFFAAPLVFVITVLLTNSLAVGQVMTGALLMLSLGVADFSGPVIFTALGVCCLAVIALGESLMRSMDDDRETLLHLFDSRN
jgi:hypothetical protein